MLIPRRDARRFESYHYVPILKWGFRVDAAAGI
jgi:hypothetical protein